MVMRTEAVSRLNSERDDMTAPNTSQTGKLLVQAEAAAVRLALKLSLGAQEIPDLRQDLMVDLIARLAHYDCRRGSLGAFAGVVFHHRASRIAARIRLERRLFGPKPVSLDDPLPGNVGTRGDLVLEGEGYSAWLGQPTDATGDAELRLMLARGVASLDRRDRQLCAALTTASVDDLARDSFGRRSTLYRRLTRIRLDLLCRGVVPAGGA
jgi:RNA polymerase sigma-70 factor (ECF subfamily)